MTDDPYAGCLAVEADVVAALGRALTSEEQSRLPGILLKASALFRYEAKQDFTEGRSQPRLKVNGGRVYLPQRPVTTVHSAVDDCGDAVEYERKDQWLTTCLGSTSFVTVDYEHGSATVPDLVRLTIAEIGSKVLSVPASARQGSSGYTKTAGPFTEQWQYAGWAQGGQTGLSPDDLAIARSFRVRVPTVHVAPSPIPRDRWADQRLGRLP
jgi:hypothetical protein